MTFPRYATPAGGGDSLGPALVETARALDVACPCGCGVFMPWQLLPAQIGLEHDGAGRLAYRDVAITVPRQSGKTTLMLSVIVHRMLAGRRQRVAYGAQTRIAARSKLLDTLWPMIKGSSLAPLFKPPSRAMGSESLRSVNGSILTLLSTEESTGHGETLDLVVLDECWAMGPAVEQATRPAMATRKNAQIWMLSTAGTEKSTWWRSKIEGGRTATQAGLGHGLAYFEWSASEDTDVFDQATWPSFMPALGHTIDESVVAADLAVMAPREWRRAYANQWPDESDEGWKVIQQDVWAASEL